ncbi:MAG: hypothetical protein QXM38_04240 [Candidatus Aenigmatarchaeota archaeon]
MGVRSIGYNPDDTETTVERNINALPFIAYYDIYKNYYANKQEERGYVITPKIQNRNPWSSVTIYPQNIDIYNVTTSQPLDWGDVTKVTLKGDFPIPLDKRGNALATITIPLSVDGFPAEAYQISDLFNTQTWIDDYTLELTNPKSAYSSATFTGKASQVGQISMYDGIALQEFLLSSIDTLREALLVNSPMSISSQPISYAYAFNSLNDTNANYSQAGLAIKTYQSDIFNNWISTEWLDGENGINAISAVDTSEGYFTIDQLNLSKKVYDMLNRIAVSGGTYQDWLEVSYDIDTYFKAETPIYCGGLSKEIIFTEVISNAETEDNPLGTLAGRGTFSDKHKGGYVVVKVDEPSYIIGIASITPRIDYSQGNDWDVGLSNMGQLHVPALDGIGFQDLLLEQLHGMTWNEDTGTSPAIGKQPAWINYMTNYNRVYGNFAEPDNQMFMTLNRRYTPSVLSTEDGKEITLLDITTYIDPTKYNYAFADTELDAQNFWVQIGVGIEARRKMSAKQIPNL